MTTPEQLRMDEIFDNYYALSAVLREDAYYILETRDDCNPKWRRQYVRCIVPHIEGLVYCFAEVCRQIPKTDTTQLSNKENKVILNKCGVGADESFKLTLKLFYKIMNLSPTPDFSGPEWTRVQHLFSARHTLMHPKSAEALVIDDNDWHNVFDGSKWALRQLFQIDKLLSDKFGIPLNSR